MLRCHLSLIVPEDVDGQPACGVFVDDITTFHKQGEIIVFDDSKRHFAFNRHPTHSRVVLIFDVARPAGLPLGEAKGSMTAELDAFIDYFK